MKNKWANIPFKSKIIISMFLVSAFQIIIISLFSYNVVIEEARERMDFMALSKAREVQGQVEKVLENIRDSYIETFVSQPITTIMNENVDYPDYGIQARAINQLKGPLYLSNNISGFTFVNFETDWVLSNRGMYRFSEANNQEEILELTKGGNYQTAYLVNNIRQNDGESIGHNTINTSGFFMVYELPVPSDRPKYLVTVNISVPSLVELAENNDGYGVTVLDAEGMLIFSTDKEMTDYYHQQGGELTDNDLVKISKKDKIRMNQLSSSGNGFTYIMTYENSLLQQGGEKIANLSFVLIIVMLSGAGITYLVGANIYRPVSQLANKVSALVKQDGQRDKDDFRSIEDGILNLAENIGFMEETIINQKEMLEDVLISKLLSGTISEDEINSYLEKLGQGHFSHYSMMALSFVGEAQWNLDPDKNILLATIRAFIKREAHQSIFLTSAVWGRMIVFLIGENSSLQKEEKISKIKVQLEELLNQKEILTLRFGVSREFYSLRDTFRALHESVEAAKIISEMDSDLSKETKYSTITMYAELVENTVNSYAYPMDQESKIKELVDLCKKEEACIAVNSLIDDLYEKKMPAEERRYYLQRLLLSILEVANNAGIGIMEIENLANQDLFIALQQIYDVQKVKEYLSNNVITPIIEQLIIFRSKNVQSIEEKVYALIKKSRGDITLAECATELNYHPNYIGRVLRCENNTAFTAYVAAEKLKYAKELLLETELSIADIAEQLNYTNSQNFIRFFNKQECMTPGRYRKSSGIKNNSNDNNDNT